MTWRAETANKSRTIQITVNSRDGQTTLRLEENLTQFAAGLFAGTTGGVGGGLGVGFGVGFGLNVLGSALFATLFPLGVAGLSFIGSRAIYRAIECGQARLHLVEQLFEQLFHEVKACLADLALPPGDDPFD